jgi:hypothetical protein
MSSLIIIEPLYLYDKPYYLSELDIPRESLLCFLHDYERRVILESILWG